MTAGNDEAKDGVVGLEVPFGRLLAVVGSSVTVPSVVDLPVADPGVAVLAAIGLPVSAPAVDRDGVADAVDRDNKYYNAAN